MSDLSPREPREPVRRESVPPELSRATPSEDYGDLGDRRNRRIRIVAWTVIVALILGGGGATVITLFLR